MDRRHNSPSSICNQEWYRIQQEHITAFSAHQLLVLTQLHASLQLWMRYKVKHKLTSCLKFQKSTKGHYLWLHQGHPQLIWVMLALGMSCSISRNQQKTKAGNLAWIIRQDNGTGWINNSGSQDRFLNMAYALQLSWIGSLICPPDINLYCLRIRDLNLPLLQC